MNFFKYHDCTLFFVISRANRLMLVIINPNANFNFRFWDYWILLEKLKNVSKNNKLNAKQFLKGTLSDSIVKCSVSHMIVKLKKIMEHVTVKLKISHNKACWKLPLTLCKENCKSEARKTLLMLHFLVSL